MYDTNHEYHTVIYDPDKISLLRNRATAELYDKLSPARTLDYRTIDFKIARIPHSGRCAIMVAVRKELSLIHI